MKAHAICLLFALPAMCAAEGLKPLDNSDLSEKRITTGLTETQRDQESLEEVEEQQRRLPQGDTPTTRPGPPSLLPREQGLTPTQQQFVDSFRDVVSDYNNP